MTERDEIQLNESLQNSPAEKANSHRLFPVLSEQEQLEAKALADSLDWSSHHALINFGHDAQKRLLTFSQTMIDHLQRKDVGEVSSIMKDLMVRLDDINPDELSVKKKGLFSRLFGRAKSSVQEILSQYQKTSAQIDRISVRLTRSKNLLISDIHLLEQLYESNKKYFHDLNILIAAAETKLAEVKEQIIPDKRKLALELQDEMKMQEAEDMEDFAERLEKRIYDLKISRQITIQTAPQIRLIQQTNQTVVEKIQSSIMTAIPLWRNQLSIALTLLRQKHAMETESSLRNATGNIIEKNTEMIRMNASGSQGQILEIAELKETQQKLLSAIEETIAIQVDGSQTRQQAEHELKTVIQLDK